MPRATRYLIHVRSTPPAFVVRAPVPKSATSANSPMMIPRNILQNADVPPSGEHFEPLLEIENVVIERIVSSGSPDPVEYRQKQHEWVLLVKGEATLDVAGAEVALTAGDYLFLEAGTPHRVTRAAEGSVWLGVHIRGEAAVAITG